jgi:hypothetical protein
MVTTQVEKYGRDSVGLFAHAFAAIGASAIAQAFLALADAPAALEEERPARLNALITGRQEPNWIVESRSKLRPTND